MKAVILAAGEGTRLNKGWTIVPKPLIEIKDKTIIEHVIDNLKDAGIKEFVLVVGFMSEHIKDYLRNGIDRGIKIEYVYSPQYKDNLITSLAAAKTHVDGREPFILCMADLFFDSSIIKNLLKRAEIDKSYACIDRKISQARRIEEKVKVKLSKEELVEMALNLDQFQAIDCGIYLLDSSIFPEIEENIQQGKKSLPELITTLAKKEQFFALDIGEEEVIDIDREKDVEYVTKKWSKTKKQL